MRPGFRWFILIFCIAPAAGLCFSEHTDAAQRDKGTVWVDMTAAPPTFEFQPFSDALALRLPNRRIAPKPESAGLCPENGPNDAVVGFETGQDGGVFIAIISCTDGTLRLREPLKQGTDETDLTRNAAVSTVLALDAATAAPPPAPTHSTVNRGDASLSAPTRTRGLIAFAPGATVTFGGNGAFTGFMDAGVLFINGLGIAAGADFSTRIRGSAVKKNETPAEGTEVGVTDVRFRVGLFYRFQLPGRWFLESGMGVGYTHAKCEDMTEGKFAVEETTPSARGAGFITLTIGVRIKPFFALALRVMPAVSFGERQYTVRGEEAVNFGWGTADTSLGAVFYL